MLIKTLEHMFSRVFILFIYKNKFDYIKFSVYNNRNCTKYRTINRLFEYFQMGDI